MTGPIILSRILAQGQNWRNGYLIVSIIQFSLAVVIFITLPMWRKVAERDAIAKKRIRQNKPKTCHPAANPDLSIF